MSLKQTILMLVVASVAGFVSGQIEAPKNHGFQSIEPAAGMQKSSALDTGVLRCAYVPYAPFFKTNYETGKNEGVMVDVMEAVAAKMDIAIEWREEVGWGTMFEGFKTDRYDAVCSSIWQVTARAKRALFSKPIGYSPVHAWKKKDAELSADYNKQDVAIATIDGEFNAIIAKNRFPLAQIVSLPQTAPFSELIMQITTGKADVVFLDGSAAQLYLDNNKGKIEMASNQTLAQMPNVIAFQPEQILLKQAFDTAMYELIQEGIYNQILAKHGLGQEVFIAAAAD